MAVVAVGLDYEGWISIIPLTYKHGEMEKGEISFRLIHPLPITILSES